MAVSGVHPANRDVGRFLVRLGNTDVNAEIATACFRIVQEALTNISRHARATQVDVRVGLERAYLVLQVRDNGCGLSSKGAGSSGRLGLVGMRERAEMLGGTLTIRGAPGHGTAVIASIPVDGSVPETPNKYPWRVATPVVGRPSLEGSVWQVVSSLNA